MTEMTFPSGAAAWVISVTLFGSLIYGRWKRRLVRRVEYGEAVNDALAKHTEALAAFVSDSSIPAILQDRLLQFSDSLADRPVAERIQRLVGSGLGLFPLPPPDESERSIIEAIERLTPPAADLWRKAVAQGAIACLFRHADLLGDLTVALRNLASQSTVDLAVTVARTPARSKSGSVFGQPVLAI